MEVEWTDAHLAAGWQELAATGGPLVTARTRGYLVSVDRASVRVAMTINSERQCADVMVIPRGMVTRIRRGRP